MKISTLQITHRIKHLQPIFTLDKNVSAFCSGGINGEVKLWDTACNHIKTIKKHAGSVTCVRFSPDGRFLASSGDDGKIFVMDSEGKDVIRTIKHPCDVTRFEWVLDHLVSADLQGTVIVTRTDDFSEVKRFNDHPGAILGMAVSPSGRLICTHSEGKIVLYEDFILKAQRDIEKGVVLESLQAGVSFSPCGTFISAGLQFNRKIPTVDILDLSLNQVFSLAGHVAPCEVATFCPTLFKSRLGIKHSLIAVASQDLSLSVWSSLNPKPFLLIKNFTESPVLDLMWDGMALIASSYDGVVKKIEFLNGELGEVIDVGNVEGDGHLPFSDVNVELKRSHDKRIDKLNLENRLEVIKLMGFICKDGRSLEQVLKEQTTANTPERDQIQNNTTPTERNDKPKRIMPVMLDKPKNQPVFIKKDTSTVVLFDVNLPEKIRLENTPPFKITLGDYAVQLDDTENLTIYRASRFFYKITGPCHKVCFNDRFVVLYAKHVQIYELTTGNLVLPFISIRLTHLDLLDDQVLLLDCYGSFTVLEITDPKSGKVTAIAGKLAKTKGLTKIQLSSTHFLVTEYDDGELLFFDRKLSTWFSINPRFSSITTTSIQPTSNDDTLAELEAAFVNYSHVKDGRRMKGVIEQVVGVLKRMKRLEEFVEYKIERMLEMMNDKKFIKAVLEELNCEKEFQRFVTKLHRKYFES